MSWRGDPWAGDDFITRVRRVRHDLALERRYYDGELARIGVRRAELAEQKASLELALRIMED